LLCSWMITSMMKMRTIDSSGGAVNLIECTNPRTS
jgi:hypothetical protein